MFRPTVWQRFFGRHGIGPMTDDGRQGKGQHDQRDMTVPAMPGTAFVVIEAEFVLGGLETVLDSPAMAFDQHQLLHWRALGAPGGEEGQIAIGNVAADQETSRPLSSEGTVVFAGIEIDQFEIGPVVQARTFGSFGGDRARDHPARDLGLRRETHFIWHMRRGATRRRRTRRSGNW